ncbi:MAG TPA: hypothetical protein DCS93_15510 [Microscillaceae bacterium]|nr:hypothetical protein [Microscillaceae bacterium]
MKRSNTEKIRQLLHSNASESILLGLQLMETFELEEAFLTELSYLGYFINSDLGRIHEAAQQIFIRFTSAKLHEELKTQTQDFFFPEDILEGIGILCKPQYRSLCPSINIVSLVQSYLKDYYYHPAQILHFLVENDLSLSEFEFTQTMEEIDIQFTATSLPLEHFHRYFPKVKELCITNNAFAFSNPPFEIFKQLEKISIAHNNLRVLPSNIAEARHLHTLDASHNELPELPENFGQLQQLTHLELHQNQLSALPESFGNLYQLDFLNLRDNHLSELPTTVQNLTKLRSVSLESNLLTSIPEGIVVIRHLTELLLGNNPLKLNKLPTNLSHMEDLKHLSLFENQLSSIPEFIFTLPYLQYLKLANNQLTTLPEQLANLTLRYLDLSHNQLTDFSAQLVKPKFIKEINLEGNPMTTKVVQELRQKLPRTKVVF